MGTYGYPAWQVAVGLFILVWALLWIFIPFIIMGINNKTQRTNELLRELIRLQKGDKNNSPEKVGLFD